MLSEIHAFVNKEATILIDFSTQEMYEEIVRLEKIKEEAQLELNQLLANHQPIQQQELRNVAVDGSDQLLRDDRNTDAKELYDEARRVQERLDASKQVMKDQQEPSEEPGLPNTAGKKTEIYTGPSVMSYFLDGRKAMRLPVPVYQCNGGGDVTVNIEVNRGGRVTSATIHARSTNNTCLHEAAIRAALSSQFTADTKAVEPQKGNIVYRFIAQ